jgi:TRAP-type C4-dicarboxylate transport system substrate-binding protein
LKYHMDAALYVTTFVLVFNKAKYGQMSDTQKKVIDDHCTNEWAGKIAEPWADFERAGVAKLRVEAGHEVYQLTPEQLAQWKKAAEPLEQSWSDNVRKVGVDPVAAMRGFKDQLTKWNAGY